MDAQQQGHACYDGQGQQVPCCAWEPAPWVPPYMSLASITLLWTVFLCGQIRKFVISGTIAQWCGPPSVPLLRVPHADKPRTLGVSGICIAGDGSQGTKHF